MKKKTSIMKIESNGKNYHNGDSGSPQFNRKKSPDRVGQKLTINGDTKGNISMSSDRDNDEHVTQTFNNSKFPPIKFGSTVSPGEGSPIIKGVGSSKHLVK